LLFDEDSDLRLLRGFALAFFKLARNSGFGPLSKVIELPMPSGIVCPLNPPRSNSSSKLSRRDVGVFTRPSTSVFSTTDSSAFVVFVIAERYDTYDSPD
jgi:hypothetical protein